MIRNLNKIKIIKLIASILLKQQKKSELNVNYYIDFFLKQITIIIKQKKVFKY